MRDQFEVRQDFMFSEFIKISLYGLFRTRALWILFLFITGTSLLSSLLGLATTRSGAGLSELRWALLPIVFIPLFFTTLGLLITSAIFYFKPQLVRGNYYRFTHWGMERYGDAPDFSLPWREISKIREINSYYIFFTKGNKIATAHFIQKRMFASKTEQEEFLKFCIKNLPLF